MERPIIIDEPLTKTRTDSPNRSRLEGEALVVILLVLLMQSLLSERISVIKLLHSSLVYQLNEAALNPAWEIAKFGVFLVALIFWLFRRRREQRLFLILANCLLTVELFASAYLLVLILQAARIVQAYHLIEDSVVVAVTNVLIFALWFWIIDSSQQAEVTVPGGRFHFLFPQRAAAIAGWSAWRPGIIDYVFLAFAMGTAFGPTDTPILGRRAKVLAMLEVLVSLVVIVVVVGRAISVFR